MPVNTPKCVTDSSLIKSQISQTSRFHRPNAIRQSLPQIVSKHSPCKVRSTLKDYLKLRQNGDVLNDKSLQNTMNHVVAF